ncbi:MAG: hypothetical protein AB7I38_05480 [Dehalococcoidia bacterium]
MLVRPGGRGLPRRVTLVPLILVVAACSAFAYARPALDAQSLSLGEENSWIRVQNLGGEAASVDVTFYDRDGNVVAEDGCPDGGCGPIEPGFGWSFFQQGFGGVAEGYRGSAFVTADQPFVALLARDVFKGGQFQIAGDTLRLGQGTSTLYLPVVQNHTGYVSRISVQNSSETADACVRIEYWAEGASSATAVDPPGPTSGCPDGGARIPARGTLVRDETNLPVTNFEGAAIVRAVTTGSGVGASAQRLAATVDTRDRDGAGLATYRGIGPDEVSGTVALPQVDRNASDLEATWSTRFRILNASPGGANQVKLRYEGTNGDGERVEIEHEIVVTSALTCDQAASGVAGCLPDEYDLPQSFRGTVRIIATSPIAVVAQRRDSDGSLDNYRGLTTEAASRQVMLPVVNKNYGPFGEQAGWNSSLRVLTFDGSTAHVRVIYFSKEFPTGRVYGPVSIDGESTLRQWEDGGLPDGWVGSAIVVSDQPVVVVANIETEVFSGDRVLMYGGVSIE